MDSAEVGLAGGSGFSGYAEAKAAMCALAIGGKTKADVGLAAVGLEKGDFGERMAAG